MTAQYWCNDKGNAVEEPAKSAAVQCVNNKIQYQSGYYGNLSCPFDVALTLVMCDRHRIHQVATVDPTLDRYHLHLVQTDSTDD